MPLVKLSNQQIIVIDQLNRSIPDTMNRLPYTPEFDALYEEFVRRTNSDLDKNSFWCALSSARKASKLMRNVLRPKEGLER